MKASSVGLREIRVHFGAFDFVAICIFGEYAGAQKYASCKFDLDPGTLWESDEQRAFKPLGRVFYRGGYVPILWMPSPPRTPREHGTLAHEMLHVVGHLIDWAAIPRTTETEEVFCHALSHGVTTVLEALKKRKR